MKKKRVALDPPRARMVIVPANGERSFLCDKETLHTTALVGAIPGPGNLALLSHYQRPVFSHEDQECIGKIGETFMGRGLVPFTMTGNEGYAPCHGCGLPLAGPSPTESTHHPPLPIPDDIAEMLYGSESRYPFQAAERLEQTRKNKKPVQLLLFDA